MQTQVLWAKIADLNGTLVAVEHERSSWAEFDAEMQRLLEWLWEQDASEIRDDLVEELQWTAEHAQNRRTDRTHDSLRRAVALLA